MISNTLEEALSSVQSFGTLAAYTYKLHQENLASTQLRTYSMSIILRHYVSCALIRVTLSIVVFNYWQ